MTKLKNRVFILSFLLAVIPLLAAQAFSLVPCTTNCTTQDLILLIIRIINYMLSAAGALAVLFVLISGFRMVTASGNPQLISQAKESLTRAIIGFAIILLSFVMINAVLQILGVKCGNSWWQAPLSLVSDQNCLLP